MGRNKDVQNNYLRYVGLALSFGLTLAATLLLGFYAGRWLDRLLGTSPLFMIVGIVAAVGLSFWSLLEEFGVLHPGKQRGKNGED